MAIKVKHSTDDKANGKKVRMDGMKMIVGDKEFKYEKIVVNGADIVASNSNYEIHLTEE